MEIAGSRKHNLPRDLAPVASQRPPAAFIDNEAGGGSRGQPAIRSMVKVTGSEGRSVCHNGVR